MMWKPTMLFNGDGVVDGDDLGRLDCVSGAPCEGILTKTTTWIRRILSPLRPTSAARTGIRRVGSRLSMA